MRLSSILSNAPSAQFEQIEGFFGEKRIGNGKQQKIDIGTIGLSFFYKNCNDVTTFCAGDKDNKEELYCLKVNDNIISIDCVVKCSRCKAPIPVWFLIESEEDMFLHSVKCRILKRRENLADKATCLHSDAFGNYTPLLEKANVAYREGLGAGVLVYLRKMFEQVTCAAADSVGIARKTAKGGHRRFPELLQEVNEQCKIIPDEFSANGYKLFGELSDVLHGDYDEVLGLNKYEYLRRLVVGIIENIKNKRELAEAVAVLGLNDGVKNNEQN